MTRTVRPTDLGALGAGLLALVAGTAFGWDARLVEAVVEPPTLVRAILVGLAVALGVGLLRAAFERLAGTADAPGATGPARRDLPAMVRGIRLVFLAVAAFAAAVGWLVGHPLPIVVALVIAAIDVIETSFLLIVVRFSRSGGPAA